MNFTRQTQAYILLFVIFGLSLAYAITRYQIVGSVPWRDLPFYILNKAISFNALILILMSLSLSALQKMKSSIATGLVDSLALFAKSGFVLVMIHLLMSILLFGSSYYGKFFTDNQNLTLNAGLSMLGGILAFIILWSSQREEDNKNTDSSNTLLSNQSMIFLLLFLLAMHLYFMGYEGWIEPTKWYGFMPPISLVAFISLIIAFVIQLKEFVTQK